MAAAKTVEALPILVSSSLGLLYVLFLVEKRDIVLIAIFCLIVIRCAAALIVRQKPEVRKGEE
ncbi:MAG: hypothetical protein QHJ34_00975 [bacterium]|nr:hypothetical protein [candidate division KSB1 bacterium]MDH7558790.1 hypothetical protein [bacterium]